ncbi:T9SS type A sorting domain-containing protein [Polaribacter sp. Asnod1-A03]|uniref:T9SS type A sorting domain-containing protein n=1 Tax=Polaribacter sp. Asnod1-A03 TaxID=3160581 RepID=UPI00386F8309
MSLNSILDVLRVASDNSINKKELNVSISNKLNSNAILELYSIEDKALIQEKYPNSTQEIKLNVHNISSGIYPLKIKIGNAIKTKRVRISIDIFRVFNQLISDCFYDKYFLIF